MEFNSLILKISKIKWSNDAEWTHRFCFSLKEKKAVTAIAARVAASATSTTTSYSTHVSKSQVCRILNRKEKKNIRFKQFQIALNERTIYSTLSTCSRFFFFFWFSFNSLCTHAYTRHTCINYIHICVLFFVLYFVFSSFYMKSSLYIFKTGFVSPFKTLQCVNVEENLLHVDR